MATMAMATPIGTSSLQGLPEHKSGGVLSTREARQGAPGAPAPLFEDSTREVLEGPRELQRERKSARGEALRLRPVFGFKTSVTSSHQCPGFAWHSQEL